MSFQSLQFIINPSAGQGNYKRVLRVIDKTLLCADLQHTIKVLQHRGEAISIAKEAADCCDVVVAVGGDGTVNEVFNGIIGTQTILGIIPAGTGNGFARAIGLPLRIKKACRVLLKGRVKEIDVGVANDRYFLGTAGVGFDALISRFAGKTLGPLRGMWLYFLAGVLLFYRFKPPLMSVEIDSEVIEVRPLVVAIANTKRYGGRALIAPDAEPDDGLLDVCIIRKMGTYRFLRHLPKLFNGRHVRLSEVTMHKGKKITINAPEPMPLHVDGEAVGDCSSIKFTVIPKAIRVLVPENLGF